MVTSASRHSERLMRRSSDDREGNIDLPASPYTLVGPGVANGISGYQWVSSSLLRQAVRLSAFPKRS